MNMHRHHSAHLDPLPTEYDQSLVQVDAKLTREFADQAVPEGLSERVYEASVSHLPAQQTLRFSPARHVQQLQMISRLSMAAAVLLAIAVGVVVLRSPSLSGSADQFAHRGTGPAVSVTLANGTEHAMSMEQEWVLLDSVELAHLAEIRHLSLADVTDDMALLVRELEM